MTPANFPEANATYGPPKTLDENQCRSVPAYDGEIKGGSCDGLPQVVVAYDLTAEEIQVLLATGRIFLSVVGGLPPHFLSFDFHAATHPA